MERDSERHYLCAELVHTLSVVLMGLGWLWGVSLIAEGIPFFAWRWLSPLLLILGSAASYRWRERRLPAATGALLGALWLASAVAAIAASGPLFLLGLAAAVVVAGVLSRPPAIVFLGALSLGPTLWLLRTGAAPGDLAAAILLILAGALGLAWLLCRQLTIALEWSWKSRQYATQQMKEARERRAELRRALKAIDEENERLARLNRELMAARREAEESRRLKAEFAANVSHELRTPLNLILGFSEMMYTAPESYGGQSLPPEYRADMHAIYRSARHLQSLIDDVLDLSRIDAKRMALTRETMSIGDCVSEAAGAIRELVQRKGLDFGVDIEEGLPPVSFDRTRIRQVLLNLISNAVRFTDQGYIRVSCCACTESTLPAQHVPHEAPPHQALRLPDTRYICISVSDSGIGIRSQDRAHIFEEFRQVDGSVRRKQGGTGLGLAISKRFVEMHGGWMWVESEMGHGSIFRFVLPAEDEWGLHPELTQTAAVPHPAQKTLVFIDDDANVVQLLRRYLQDHRIESARDAEQAGPLIAEICPDLVALGNSTRPEDVLALQRNDPRLAGARLSVLSCHVRSDHRQALALGMTDYLTKPITQKQLLGAMAYLGLTVRTVLAVEDEPDMMRLLGRILASQAQAVQLLKAYSGEQAQALLRSLVPDLVLLDLSLPGMSGQDLLRWMKGVHRLRDVPVIGISAQTHLEEAETLDLATLTLSRQEGFALPELLTFIEMVAERFPSRYAAGPS